MLSISAAHFALVRAAAALVQAGGGGSFGGGGGGGDGGDVGALLQVLFHLLRFTLRYPAIGIPIWIVVAIVVVVGARRGWWKHQERTIRRTRPERASRRSIAVSAQLRAQDPDFDEALFLRRVATAFEKAQAAWCAQALEPIRAFVSDGVFERFSLQVEQQREEGWRQGMSGVDVQRCLLQHVESGRHFDTVTVRIAFEAQIDRVALGDGQSIEGSELPRSSFEECWSFVRRRGAKSKNAEGLIEGKCPNCGAPLSMNQSEHCATCKCLVRSGEFDWVLSEITQASEWSVDDERAVRGFAEYVARDPGLSVQLLEDRTSVAFWRWGAADRTGRIDPLTRIADAEMCARAADEIAERAKSARTYMQDRAVGSVRALGILPRPVQDRAVVEVIWDGRLVTLEPGEHPTSDRDRDDDRRVRRNTLFVLARKSGVVTRVSEAFTTMRCGNCGAHDAGGTDPKCPYCGAPRTGDASQWLVTAIAGPNDPLGARLRSELAQGPLALVQTIPSPSALLAWGVATVRADGTIDERERQAVLRLAHGFGVPPERVAAMLDGPLPDLSAPLPGGGEETRAWLRVLCNLALSDGDFSAPERAFLTHAAERLGVPHGELKHMIGAARASLYRG
jgi:hypothetical protein